MAGGAARVPGTQPRGPQRALLAIRGRWLIAATVIAVALIAGIGYWSELARSEAGLADLGDAQRAVAEAAALALAGKLAAAPRATTAELAAAAGLATLERPGVRVMLAAPPPAPDVGGPIVRLDGTAVQLPPLADALQRGDDVLRVDPADAGALGLPARTAMVGLSRAPGGWSVAVAATAEHQRDRDREGRLRLLGSVILAAALLTAFGTVALQRQRAQLELQQQLAVAETARARDAELERLSRVATMAAIASGVAHELSTPLGVIVGRAEQVLGRPGIDDRTQRAATTIIEQADHIDRVVRGLLGLARGAPIALEAVVPATLAEEAAALVAHRFERAGIELRVEVDTPSQIRGEAKLLVHAIVNLLLNACDASPTGAAVQLAVTADHGEVVFAVDDAGSGIAPADVARATEPFFTTKPAGQGTGLGLAIAHEIASSHRGTLRLVPRTPTGTHAEIRIPIATAAAEAVAHG
jgi:signal transduction histidine kinase